MNAWKKIEQKQFSPVYLLYGTESFLINETKQKLVANVLTKEDLDFNLSVYDLEETPIEVALEDAETIPFIGEKKLVILQNPIFLTAEKQKNKIEHNVKKLEEFLQMPPIYTVVVFAGTYEKLDERKKITKLLKKTAEVIEVKKMGESELKVWIREKTAENEVQIDESAIELLLVLVGSDLMKLDSEIQKLSLFATDTKRIDENMVDNLTSRSIEQNIFSLVDKVVHRKMDEAFRIYYDLRKQNEEPIKILALLAGQFRLVYQVKELMKRGYGQQQIASSLKTHPFRVKLASGQARSFSEEALGEIMQLLAKSDEDLKTGAISRDLAVELFLFKLGSLKV